MTPYGANKRPTFDASALYGTRVPGEGPRTARVALVGERPGKDEARQGKPFVGAAGTILRAFLLKVGLNPDHLFITNLVKTYEDRDPTPEEIARDEAELLNELRFMPNLKVIGALGAHATRWCLGPGYTMEVAHGIPHQRLIWQPKGTPPIIVPVYHPASGLYKTNDLLLTFWDLAQLKNVVDGGLDIPTDPYDHPLYEKQVGRGVLRGGTWAVDTEGYARDPWMASYSQKPGTATVAMPGKFTIGSEVRVLLHNAVHDLPVLAAMGSPLEDGQFEDTMLKAYNLGGVHPQGLKALAYRLCGITMSSYDELINPVKRGLMLEYLRLASEEDWGPKIEGDRRMPLGAKIRKAVREAEDGPVERWRGWSPEDRGRITAAIGPPPAPTIHDLPESVAVHYAARDADATGRIDPLLDRLMREAGTEDSYRLDLSVVPAVARMREVGVKIDPLALAALGQDMQSQMSVIENDLGLNPDSGDQVAIYLFHARGLKSPKMTKGGTRESTNDRVLEGLRGKHPHVALIMDYRECSKIKSSYCQGLIDRADAEGRVHADLNQRANSGRFTCKEPNLLAIPTRMKTGKMVRNAFVAGEGRVLGDWDFSQIEMRVLADESGDERLIKVFRTGGDVHAETAADMYGIPLGQVDEDKHRYPAKRVGFGVITGITENGLLDQFNMAGANVDGRWTLETCKDAIDAWFGVHPGVKTFMEACRTEARRYGRVRDRWGRIRYLPGIWAPIARIREEAERQSHSHKIQGGAAGLIKKALAALWPWFKEWRGGGRWAEMLLPVHDEILFEVEEDADFIGEAALAIQGEMENATELSVPIKAKGGFGRTWREAKEAG